MSPSEMVPGEWYKISWQNTYAYLKLKSIEDKRIKYYFCKFESGFVQRDWLATLTHEDIIEKPSFETLNELKSELL